MLAGIAGAIVNWLRPTMRGDETPLYERGSLVVFAPCEDRAFERLWVGARWNDDGTWDHTAWPNILYYTVGFALAPVVLGVVGWSERAMVVATVCAGAGTIGMQPLFCP